MSATSTSTRPDLAAWIALLRAHSRVVRELSAELVAEHGLTISDYEVLLWLSRADDRRMRPVDLAGQVLLSPSGITRLLSGLERAGYVCRTACPDDARVSYAELTDEGLEKLRAASKTHLEGVERLFLCRFDERERTTLARLLGRLDAEARPDCPPG
jgi:DNA-binding MarR family transcriptional regulator